MEPITVVILAGVAYYAYEKNKNPAWTPFASLMASPLDKHVALEKVKVTSVPTPSPTVALDPHMTTDQVKQVNAALTTETDPVKLAAHAQALSELGHESSGKALAAKANAVGEAKALGASEIDIHKKHAEAAASTVSSAAPMPIDAPMAPCEAQVLLNALVTRQGHAHVEGIPVPIPITNVFDADTAFLVQIFQAEAHLPTTGIMDAATARALRTEVLRPPPEGAALHAAGWGPALTGSSGPMITGFDRFARFDRGGRGFGGDRGFEHRGFGGPGFEHRDERHPFFHRPGGLEPWHHHHHPEFMPPPPPPPPPWHHHHHHHHHPEMMEMQAMQQPAQQFVQQPVAQQQVQQQAAQVDDAGGADDAGAGADADTKTGWWVPLNYAYDPYSNSGFGGYGQIGWGGPGGLGGYGSWGSYGGWGHGL